MKHILISVLIFALMLAFCTWSAFAVRHAAEPVYSLLTAAQRSMQRENYESAGRFAAMANDAWRKNEVLFGILLRHDETDEVMRHFAALVQNAADADAADFSSTCAELLCQLQHISQMQRPSLENVL